MQDKDGGTDNSRMDGWITDVFGVDPASYRAADGADDPAPGDPPKSPAAQNDPAGCASATPFWERVFWGDAQDPAFFASPGAIYFTPDGVFAVNNKSQSDVALQFNGHIFETDRITAPAGAETKVKINPAAAGTGGTIIAVVNGSKTFQDAVICSAASPHA